MFISSKHFQIEDKQKSDDKSRHFNLVVLLDLDFCQFNILYCTQKFPMSSANVLWRFLKLFLREKKNNLFYIFFRLSNSLRFKKKRFFDVLFFFGLLQIFLIFLIFFNLFVFFICLIFACFCVFLNFSKLLKILKTQKKTQIQHKQALYYPKGKKSLG